MVNMKSKYIVIKKNNHQKTTKLKIVNSYDMSSKNKIANGITVNKINLVDQKLIEKMLDRKINKRFKSLLELIASVCESDDDPASGLMYALDETERFKREMLNKYNRLLKKEQKEFIDKKIALVEKEVKKRLYNHQMLAKAQRKLMEEALLKAMMEEDEIVIESHRRR